MIRYITGVIGSGKTYFGMLYIAKNFLKDDNLKSQLPKRFFLDNVDYCFTNINDLKIDKFDNTFIIQFNDFYDKLSDLYSYYRDGVSDIELNKKASEYNLSKCLIVIDECHNYLSKKDDVLVWWLSYARHLFQEIILITQNLSLVDPKYKAFSEHFYKAYPTSLKLFKNHMKYNIYSDSRMFNTTKTESFSVKIYPYIFELYHSGQTINNKSFVQKFLVLGLILFVLFSIIFFIIRHFFFSNNSNEINDNFNNTSSIQVVTSVNTGSNKSYNHIVFFKCSDDFCIYNDFVLDLNFAKFISSQSKVVKYYKNKLYYLYILNLDDKTFHILDNYVSSFKKFENYNNNVTKNSLTNFSVGSLL